MGRAVHRHSSAKAWDLQAGQREGRNLHQRLEHRTATSFLPLEFPSLVQTVSRNTIKRRSLVVLNFLETRRAHRGARHYDNTTRKAQLYLSRTEPPLGARRGDSPPKSHAPFLSRFSKKNPTPNSLASSDKSIVKEPKDHKLSQGQKAGRVTRRPTPPGYGTPSPPFAQGTA